MTWTALKGSDDYVCIGLEKVETHFIFYLDPCSYDASKALKFWITVINCAINHAIDFDICFENFQVV